MMGARSKLLVVEDNRETQLIIKVALRNNYDLQAVTNVNDAISSLSKNEIDLVLLDLNLSGKEDGRIILSEIRDKMKNDKLPVIIVTAYDLTPDDEKFFREKANGLITKPFDKKDLLGIINKVLQKI
ncbi:MAG: response regulator [Ignavibacteriaceae bacterium]|jgi:CheY-like chemotaxis protein|nr:response regulator [Ignavibacteriaceae bacterium]